MLNPEIIERSTNCENWHISAFTEQHKDLNLVQQNHIIPN